MSTGPGPTRKGDGSSDASIDDIGDLLVEDEPSVKRTESDQSIDDGLDVMLETPGPVLASSFLPPPPAPAAGSAAESAEDNDSAEDSGVGTNLAYEDLLAKLVLPARAAEPEPEQESVEPTPATSLPLPESLMAPATLTPAAVPFMRPSVASLKSISGSDERTLVTANPLLAEEQEAAAREARMASREVLPLVQNEMRPAVSEPMVVANGGAKSRLLYLMLGGLLVLGGMILAVLVLKLLMPTPVAQPVIIAPAPAPAPSAPPARVEPLPPSAPPAAAAPAAVAPAPAAEEPQAPAAAPAAEEPAPAADEGSAAEAGRATSKHRGGARKTAHASAPKPAAPAAPKAAPAAPKAAPATKPPKAEKKSSKSSGYADPFDN